MRNDYDDFQQDELLLRRIFEIHAQLIALQQFPEFRRSLHRKSVISYLKEADVAVNRLYDRVKFCVAPDEDFYVNYIRQMFKEIDKDRYRIPKNLQNN